jgi:hypothetical protein
VRAGYRTLTNIQRNADLISVVPAADYSNKTGDITMVQMTNRRARLKGSVLPKKSKMTYFKQSIFIGDSNQSASFLLS